MTSIAVAGSLVLGAVFLMGCPSKDNTSSSGATTPSSLTASSGSSAPTAQASGGTAAPTGTGALASLESKAPANEPWTTQDGQPLPMIYWSDLNVRISASCKQPD